MKIAPTRSSRLAVAKSARVFLAMAMTSPDAAWAIKEGLTYSDRSALRFDPEEPGKPRVFTHSAMDVHYEGKPSMLSETAWTRPNRYRGEAPLYFAAYGAPNASDAAILA